MASVTRSTQYSTPGLPRSHWLMREVEVQRPLHIVPARLSHFGGQAADRRSDPFTSRGRHITGASASALGPRCHWPAGHTATGSSMTVRARRFMPRASPLQENEDAISHGTTP